MARLVRFFSITRKFTIHAVAVALALVTLAAWWGVQTSVDAGLQARLEVQANQIQTTLSNRLSRYSELLVFLRAHILENGSPTEKSFERLTARLGLSELMHGRLKIGYAPVDRDSRSLSRPLARVTVTAPRRAAPEFGEVGEDLFENEQSGLAVKEAIRTRRPVLGEPLPVSAEPSSDASRSSFIVVYPVFQADTEEAGAPTPSAGLKGILFIAFRAQDFFEAGFGLPSLTREPVTFVLEAMGPRGFTRLYNRFDAGGGERSGTELSLEKKLTLFEREMRLSVAALPHFYTDSDRFAPALVAFAAAFMSILVLIVLKASQTQLAVETRARELGLESVKRSRAQTDLLRRLNESAQTLSSELELEALIHKVFALLSEIARADLGFFYFSESEKESSEIPLEQIMGFSQQSLLKAALPRVEMQSLVSGRVVLKQSQDPSGHVLKRLFSQAPPCKDWILVGLPTRDAGLSGLVFLARREGPAFDENEIEIIESLASQAGASIDNARLFRKVDKANRAKNAFLANMSHEIRTPLNAIIGFSEMLLNPSMGAKHREHLTTSIRKSGSQLTRLIDDILDFAKIEAGKISIEARRVRLGALMTEVRAVMEPRSREKNLQLIVESTGQLPSFVVTDEIRLKQILLNVIGNAIKFTPAGSVVVNLSFAKDVTGGNLLVFRVRDSGVGISEEAAASLFQPFSMGDNTSTRRHGGSGLGLALSRRLAQELGGDLRLIESQLDSGTIFEFTVASGDLSEASWSHSLHASSEHEVSAAAPSPLALAGARILLVEDSVDNQEIFRFFLEGSGATVELADNGRDAVAKAAAGGPFDIILMDIQIPELDGKEATKEIRRQGYRRPIVAITAHALEEERKSCMQAGCNGQITKPVSGATLVTEVAAYVRTQNVFGAVYN